jgi:hypothetical protein
MSAQLNTYMRNVNLDTFQKSLLKSGLVVDPKAISRETYDRLIANKWKPMTIFQEGGFASGYTKRFEGKLVEPITRIALSDLQDTMRSPRAASGIARYYMKMNALMKTRRFFQFYRIIVNDLVQMGTGDPRAYGKIFQAYKDFKNADKIYSQLGGLGMYNQALYITEQSKNLNNANKYLDPKLVKKLSGMDGRIAKFFKSPITAMNKFYELSGNLAWNGDKILRTAMYRQFRDNGLSIPDSVNRTQLFMAHYDRILTSQRRALNAWFFVPTYRIQMARLYKEMLKHPVKYRWAIFRTGLVKTLLGASLAPLGYSPVQNLFGMKKEIPKGLKKFFPFFGYKYSRDLDEGKKEIISVSSPMHEMDKVLTRTGAQTLLYNLGALPSATIQFITGRDFNWKLIAKRDDPLGVKLYKNLYFMIKKWFPPVELVDRITKDENKRLYRIIINSIGLANIYTLKERGLDNIAEDVDMWRKTFNNSDFGDEDFNASLKKIMNFTRSEGNLKKWDDIWKDSDKWKER